jgi:hypothetical protein
VLGVPTLDIWPGYADLPHRIDFKPARGQPLQQIFKEVRICSRSCSHATEFCRLQSSCLNSTSPYIRCNLLAVQCLQVLPASMDKSL